VVAEVSRRSNRLRAEVLRLSALVESYRALVSGRSEADKARRINARPARCASLSGDARCELDDGHPKGHRVDYGAGSFLTWG
jgi:hypothetical protein